MRERRDTGGNTVKPGSNDWDPPHAQLDIHIETPDLKKTQSMGVGQDVVIYKIIVLATTAFHG